MTTFKISQLPIGSSLSGSELLAAVQSGDTKRINVNQVSQASPNYLEVLTFDPIVYVRTVPVTITISIGSPAVASWTGHGLQIGDPVVFSAPFDRYNAQITNANPGVCTTTLFNATTFTPVNHGYGPNDPIEFTTSGTLPTGLSVGTTYYAVNTTPTTFEISTSPGGASIDTTGTQSGYHRVQRINTLPTNITNGGVYYIIAAGFGVDSFQFSTTPGGSAVNTAGVSIGRIIGQTGNDANNGSAQTRTGACLSLMGCYRNTVKKYNMNGHFVTIQLADGTYAPYIDQVSGQRVCPGRLCITNVDQMFFDGNVMPWIGQGEGLHIRGNIFLPDSVYIKQDTADRSAVNTDAATPAPIDLDGVRLAIGSVVDALVIGPGSGLFIGNVNFESCVAAAVASNGGSIFVGGQVEVLADPAGGSLYIALNGSTLRAGFNSYTMAIGTRAVPKGLFQADDDWGEPSYMENFTHTWLGNWTGIKFRTAYRNMVNNFPENGVPETNFPASLTQGVVSPQGLYWEWTPVVNTFRAGQGIDGATHDSLYNFQALPNSSAFAFTIDNWEGHVVIDSTSTVSSGTITTPSDPTQGHIINVRTSATITSLAVTANSSTFIKNPPATLAAGASFDLFFCSSNATWYTG